MGLPVDLHDRFEAEFETLLRLLSAGQTEGAPALLDRLLDRLRAGLDRVGPDLAAERLARIAAVLPPERRGDRFPATASPPGPDIWPIAPPAGLDPEQGSLPGVSVVTATRNRTANLLQALPSWLAAPEVCEVVIVDWSSDVPVAASLAQAGIGDPRVRVARVEGEAAWVLTWAFNLGFRLARHACILKADADIRLDPAFFAANPLAAGQAITGNWRTAPAGQAYINGLFYIHRADLARVQGFNEHLTRYGWDDDDLYDRLTRAGVTRIDLAPATVSHIDHDDAARLATVPEALATGWSDLRARPIYGIRTNRLIAALMPDWRCDRRMQPFAAAGGVLRRRGPHPHPVPAPLRLAAERLAAREVLSWQAGPRTLELDDAAVDLLLSVRRLAGTGALQVALMLARAPLDAVVAARLLVADLDAAALQARPEVAPALKQALVQAAHASGRCLVLRSDAAPRTVPDTIADTVADTGARTGARTGASTVAGRIFADLAHLPAETDLGPAPEVDLDGAARDATTPVLRLRVGLDLMRQMSPKTAPAPASRSPLLLAPNTDLSAPDTGTPPEIWPEIWPEVCPEIWPTPARHSRPDRLYIDAQHGLGNRLRAIGSAAAVARATGRDLVVIWRPDAHCEARLPDLFAYAGPVLEEPPALPGTATRTSYMELEPGAAKDAPLTLIPGRDAIIRSAYVLNHPASHWGADVAFLRALQPSEAVLALVRGHASHRPRPAFGVHIRREGGPGTPLHSYDSPDNWTAESHSAIRHWRGQSHHDRFIARLRPLLEAHPGATAFVAADLPDSYAALAAAFGDRVTWLDRSLYDRSASQAQHALADVLLLARARHFLGSPWSSFSELVLRLSTTIERHEKAGVDF